MAPKKLFSHKPLSYEVDQIRLIQILSRSRDPVQCSLQHYDLAACLPYKALSYTWGSPQGTTSILINGARFLVRWNLWDFLMTLQPDESEFIWIDQICVDQENTEERNHQVEFMGNIYHEASEVIIWLGCAQRGSAEAMDFILGVKARNIERFNNFSWADKVDFGSPFLSLSLSTLGQAFDLSSAPVVALRVLFRKPYWSRVWIIQEIMLARRIRLKYGNRVITWEHLQEFKVWCKANGNLRLGTCFESPSSLIPPRVKTLINNKFEWGLGDTWKAPNHDLRHVLSIYNKSECEDIRDKVYGLQGLVLFGARVPVDYDRDVIDLINDVLSVLVKDKFQEYNSKTQRAFDEFAILLAYSLHATDLPQFVDVCISNMVLSRSDDFLGYSTRATRDIERLAHFS
ncbi:HET-domain-containing protein [Hyaloscypha variabilis F]|uniref:HET-domain-containing protein n=1 Tax=Hyaloscypha variabilis (strain UAMH 11265 / GT02V1 / F) TaxID=1149755 RepID=A0A2J6R922_HYAVF|nr:HET-domain-containing protein [Hyaloscypha variabilis F]